MAELGETETPVGRGIYYCPICGVKSGDAEGASGLACISCGFRFELLFSPENPQAPPVVAARVPPFTYAALSLQILASFLMVVGFTFFASSAYSRLPLQIASSHLAIIGILGVFALLLRRRRNITVMRFALILLGAFTVPLGVCSVAAALSISTPRRYCSICRKRIQWNQTYTECSRCNISYHRLGQCRTRRRTRLLEEWKRPPSLEEVVYTCPFCYSDTRVSSEGVDRP
jgi:hypothetical protein